MTKKEKICKTPGCKNICYNKEINFCDIHAATNHVCRRCGTEDEFLIEHGICDLCFDELCERDENNIIDENDDGYYPRSNILVKLSRQIFWQFYMSVVTAIDFQSAKAILENPFGPAQVYSVLIDNSEDYTIIQFILHENSIIIDLKPEFTADEVIKSQTEPNYCEPLGLCIKYADDVQWRLVREAYYSIGNYGCGDHGQDAIENSVMVQIWPFTSKRKYSQFLYEGDHTHRELYKLFDLSTSD